MVCYKPLEGWRSRVPNPKTGRYPITFNRAQGYVDRPVTVPCGRCVGCRLEYSRQWAIRCYHEASLHSQNCFLTLTYNDEHLPAHRSLDLRDFQLFMKRFRKKIAPTRIKFYHCGEYGDKNLRPHYHALIFGYDFSDKVLWQKRKEHRLYVSASLNELWSDRSGQPLGFASIGSVTFQSAGYVSRYIMKKQTGQNAQKTYTVFDPETGEIHGERRPEYTSMSNGIGAGWYEKFKNDIYPSDFVVVDGKKKGRPPKYYDFLFERDHSKDAKYLKALRRSRAKLHEDNNTPERLRVREIIQEKKLQQLPRTLEK